MKLSRRSSKAEVSSIARIIELGLLTHLDTSLKDNDPITLPTKDLGTCEVYPQTLLHSPNGRFVSVCGDGEFIIYTALAWRNKAFGSALDFVWGSKENSNDYAIRESPTSVKIFKNFVEKPGGLDVGFQAEGLTGGVLLGVKGQGGIGFFDWQTGGLVRRIEVDPKEVCSHSYPGWIPADNSGLLVRKRRAGLNCL